MADSAPSPTVEFIPLPPVRRTVAGAMIGLAILGGAACGPDTPAPTPNVSASPSGLPGLDPEVGPCADAQYLVVLSAAEAARRCLDAMTMGKLALVYAGVQKNQVDTMAEDIEQDLNDMSGSLVTLNVVPVPATPDAVEKFEQLAASTATAKGNDVPCVDEYDAQSFMSRSVDQTMELDAYDFVMALLPPDAEFCSGPAVGGAADPRQEGRYADVSYSAAKYWAETHPGNGDEPVVIVRVLSGVGAHEVAHLLRVKHAGTVDRRDYKKLQEMAASGALKLTDFLESSRFNSFGASDFGDLMGGGAHMKPIVPNPIQQEILRWPNIVINGQAASAAESLGAEWTSLSVGDARVGKFIMTNLDRKIYFDTNSNFVQTPGDSISASFDSLAVVARTDENGMTGVELILFDTHNKYTATLGYLGTTQSGPSQKTWNVSYGSRTFEISLDQNGVQARLK